VFASRHLPSPPASLVHELLGRYGETHRAYHNATHIADVLRWFDVVWDEVGWSSPADVYAAVLFHDAIYDPQRKDNEARSADLAREHGASDYALLLIMLTSKHGQLLPGDVDRDAANFLDCDTAILGAEAAQFDAYDIAIRREYAGIPDADFKRGRRRFLESMLARPRIFLGDLLHGKLDAAARANLTRAIAKYT
jgi:predicted metal-dependent HD superfamily phosphohydrolase